MDVSRLAATLHVFQDSVQLRPLLDHPERIEEVAGWIWEEWQHLIPHEDVSSFTEAFRERLRPSGIGATVVAFWDETLAGVASLLADDLPIRPELTPWLAEVYVPPRFRHRGIGRRLVLRIMEEARAIPVPRLYLYTPDRETFYARMGWTLLERVSYAGRDQAVMQATFTP